MEDMCNFPTILIKLFEQLMNFAGVTFAIALVLYDV